jgi:hypothetical protein
MLKLLAYVPLNGEVDSFYRDALHNTSDIYTDVVLGAEDTEPFL